MPKCKEEYWRNHYDRKHPTTEHNQRKLLRRVVLCYVKHPENYLAMAKVDMALVSLKPCQLALGTPKGSYWRVAG